MECLFQKDVYVVKLIIISWYLKGYFYIKKVILMKCENINKYAHTWIGKKKSKVFC